MNQAGYGAKQMKPGRVREWSSELRRDVEIRGFDSSCGIVPRLEDADVEGRLLRNDFS